MANAELIPLVNNNAGYVYILSNPSMPGLLKIGMTTKDIKVRAKELHTTGVQAPFNIEFGLYSDDCKSLEKDIHECFKGHRASNSREFFTAELRDVVVYILDYYLYQKDEEANAMEERMRFYQEQKEKEAKLKIEEEESNRELTPDEIAANEAEVESHMKHMREMLGLDDGDK